MKARLRVIRDYLLKVQERMPRIRYTGPRIPWHEPRTIYTALGISIVLVYTLNAWLVTCGFAGCPTTAEIKSFKPDEGGRIFDRKGKLMGRLASVRRLNVSIARVPLHVQQAFIATEDRRFYKHNGLDWRGFGRAFVRNMRAVGVREGFSTITMQVARNSFVAGKYNDRSLRKKLIELRIAKLLEKTLTKDQILELYLNVIYLGNGVYGIEAASRDLFGKPVSQLTVPEGAMLAALPKGPSAYTPRRNPNRALTRRNLVLDLMVREGYITQAQSNRYQQTRIVVARDEWYPDHSNDSYALDAVRTLVDSVLKSRNMDVADVTVYTTLDWKAQIEANRSVRTYANAIQRESWYGSKDGGIEGAMVAIDPRSGDIVALVGGKTYRRGSFNRALAAHRQPGSAFKPFVYAAALEANLTPASEVDDEPIDVYQDRGRKVWTPANYGDQYFGHITFRGALEHSANAATVKVSQMVGLEKVIDRAKKNGFTSDLKNFPALALGALEVTPMELVTAYAPFANSGYRVFPRLVRRIEASNGEVLWNPQPKAPELVMDARDAYQLTSMLRSVVEFGTAHAVRDYGVRGLVAGKTGTTNDGSDVWFIGYTPTLVAGFWFGYDKPRTMSSSASGGRFAAPAWAEFYLRGWREQPPDTAWAPPDGMTEREIDAETGFLKSEYCPVTQKEYFKPGTEPTTECPVHAGGWWDQYATGTITTDDDGTVNSGNGRTEPQNNPTRRQAPKKDPLGLKKIGRAIKKIFKF
jgi:1A family penicillin-binding protein